MYYHKHSNKYISEGQEFTLNNITYSSSWLSQISAEQIADMGLEKVVIEGTKGNNRFYYVGEQYNGPIINIVNVPKDIAAIKASEINQIKTETYQILQPTDYIEVRNIRDPNYKPNWIEWRTQVIDYSNQLVDNITNAQDIGEIENILDNIKWPNDPNYISVPNESTTETQGDIS
jgi:hypothetical protein